MSDTTNTAQANTYEAQRDAASRIIATAYADAIVQAAEAGISQGVLVASMVSTGIAALKAAGLPQKAIELLVTIGEDAANTFPFPGSRTVN